MSIALFDNAARLSMPGLLTPTMTGTRPSIRFSTWSVNAACSSSESFGASPMTPSKVKPWTPSSR